MRFTKMNGAGNDFIIVENLRQKIYTVRVQNQRHAAIEKQPF